MKKYYKRSWVDGQYVICTKCDNQDNLENGLTLCYILFSTNKYYTVGEYNNLITYALKEISEDEAMLELL